MSARTGGSMGGWVRRAIGRALHPAEPMGCRRFDVDEVAAPAPAPRAAPPARRLTGLTSLRWLAQRSMDWARCVACDRPPERVSEMLSATDVAYRLTFFCHGMYEVVTIDERDLVHAPERAIHKLLDRVGALFADHANPDVRELLARR